MARVSNETRLVVALLNEKAKARKNYKRISPIKETEDRDHFFRNGIDWALKALYEIIEEL